MTQISKRQKRQKRQGDSDRSYSFFSAANLTIKVDQSKYSGDKYLNRVGCKSLHKHDMNIYNINSCPD